MRLAPYIPSIAPPAAPASDNSGVGSPEGVIIGSPGKLYIDTDNNDLYGKITGDGTTTGWSVLNSGGGGGGGGPALAGRGNPEGVETADRGTTYWDYTNNILYIKDSGSGNTGWREIIS